MSTVTRIVAPKFPYRLVSLAAPGGKNWGFAYDPVGRLLTQTLPNGLSTQHGILGTAGPLKKLLLYL